MKIIRLSWNMGDKLKMRCEWKNLYFIWFYIIILSIPVLSNTVATSHMWVFKFEFIKIK